MTEVQPDVDLKKKKSIKFGDQQSSHQCPSRGEFQEDEGKSQEKEYGKVERQN